MVGHSDEIEKRQERDVLRISSKLKKFSIAAEVICTVSGKKKGDCCSTAFLKNCKKTVEEQTRGTRCEPRGPGTRS